MTPNTVKIRPRERDSVIQALRSGVVPRIGQYLIQVGRKDEIQAMILDIDRIIDSGSTFRFVIGEYGAGKTFFINLIRSLALEKSLVTANADLSPDRRIFSSSGQSKALYMELMRNLSTRTKPDGGAITGIVEKFILKAKTEALDTNRNIDAIIQEKLSILSDYVNGYDFATVINSYWRGYKENNEQLRTDAIRWLRGEFSTKTDARIALGVRTIIDDANYYDQLKLFACFCKLAGYAGFLVCFDEMVNIYKITNTQSRAANYEQILRIVNDSLQGVASGIGFMFGGTPEFQLDTRRGMFSYEALRSRLSENAFIKAGLKDLTGPVIRLQSLSPEDFYLLLEKINTLYAWGDQSKILLPEEGITAFMEHCRNRLGDIWFRTPRTAITSFIDLLAVLEQNPGVTWQSLLNKIDVKPDPIISKIEANSSSVNTELEITKPEIVSNPKIAAAEINSTTNTPDDDLVNFTL